MRKFLILSKDDIFGPNGTRARYLFNDKNFFIIYRKNRLITYLRFLYIILSSKPYVYFVGFETLSLFILYLLGYKKFIIDTGDNECELSRSYRKKIFSRFICIIERWAIGNSLIFIVRTETYKEILDKTRKNVYLIRDGIDVDSLKEYKRLPDILTIGMIGNFKVDKRTGNINGKEIIEVVEILNKEGYNVKGFIFGKGKAFQYLKKLAVCKNVEVIEDWVSIENIGEIMEKITIGLNIQTNDSIGNIRLGGKVPIYLATSRYIISTMTGDCSRILPSEYLINYKGIYDPVFPYKVAEELKKIIKDPERLKIRFSGPEIAYRYFDYKILRKELYKILESV